MKSFLLSCFLVVAFTAIKAQNATVNTLPEGKYETVIKSNQDKWEKGDIILLNDQQYKTSKGNETGIYKFSVTAQRVFFTTGPLKNLFAKTYMSNGKPAIVFPVSENEQVGIKLPSEIWGYYKH